MNLIKRFIPRKKGYGYVCLTVGKSLVGNVLVSIIFDETEAGARKQAVTAFCREHPDDTIRLIESAQIDLNKAKSARPMRFTIENGLLVGYAK